MTVAVAGGSTGSAVAVGRGTDGGCFGRAHGRSRSSQIGHLSWLSHSVGCQRVHFSYESPKLGACYSTESSAASAGVPS